MSNPQNLTRLIRRIARQTTNPADINRALQELQQYEYWERDIAHEHDNRLSRESRRVQQANKRAHELGLPGTLTLREWLTTLDYFGWRCAYCQLPFSYDDLEHFHPLGDNSQRYGTAVANCVPACRTCNLGKGSKPIRYWLAQTKQPPLPFADVAEEALAHNIQRVATILQEWQTTHGRQKKLSK